MPSLRDEIVAILNYHLTQSLREGVLLEPLKIRDGKL